jgi:hypothetical protein
MVKLVPAQGRNIEGVTPSYYRLTESQGDAIVAGSYYHIPNPFFQVITTTTIVANRLLLTPFPVARMMNIDQLAIRVVSGVTGSARVGIYDCDPTTMAPTDLIVDSGLLSTNQGGITSTASVNVQLKPRMYYAAIVSDVAAILQGGITQQGTFYAGYTPTSATAGLYKAYTFAALPASAGTGYALSVGNPEALSFFFRIASY